MPDAVLATLGVDVVRLSQTGSDLDTSAITPELQFEVVVPHGHSISMKSSNCCR